MGRVVDEFGSPGGGREGEKWRSALGDCWGRESWEEGLLTALAGRGEGRPCALSFSLALTRSWTLFSPSSSSLSFGTLAREVVFSSFLASLWGKELCFVLFYSNCPSLADSIVF